MGPAMPMERTMSRFRDEFERLFERYVGGEWGTTAWEGLPARLGWGPRIDLAESEGDLTITCELPGIDAKLVDISVTGETLTIRGEKKQETFEKKPHYHYIEREYGEFARTVQLPASVDPNKVEARYKDGVLTIVVAKRQESKPKRINIREEKE